MKRIFFVDSENVADNWISLLNTSAPDDEILVFYTAKSPHMNYKNVITLKQSDREVTFIECFEGNNALDFQLSTYLGYRIHTISDDEFVIVANDAGYDAVVKYWRERDYHIKRIHGKACATLSSSVQEENPTPVSVPQVIETNPNGVDENAKEILVIVGKSNLQILHESLKQLYGTKKGKSIYNAFKTDNAYNNFIAKHNDMSLAEKHQSYCSIVFSVMAPEEVMPDDFPKRIYDFWLKKKNLNSLKALLQQEYGKEKGEKYYSLFKVHIKLLDKIK